MITRDNQYLSRAIRVHTVILMTAYEQTSQGQTSSAGNVWFLSTSLSKFGARGTKSRQKTGWMPHFCLPAGPNSGCAEPKVEQNLQNSEKCSTRLPSPKPCGLRLRANSKKQRFARNRGQVQWLSKWCAALPLAKSLPFTDKSMKMGSLSVNGPLEKYRLRTKWSKIAVCP